MPDPDAPPHDPHEPHAPPHDPHGSPRDPNDTHESTDQSPHESPDYAAGEDPRLRIPEVLRPRPGDQYGPNPSGQPQDARQSRRSGMAETARAWGMALDLVFTAVGMFVLGYLFDLWRGTGPWGAVIGLTLGFVTATVRLIRASLKQEAREEARRREKRP